MRKILIVPISLIAVILIASVCVNHSIDGNVNSFEEEFLSYGPISISDDLNSKYDFVIIDLSDEELEKTTVEDWVKIDKILASGSVVIVSSNLDKLPLESNHVFDPNSRYSAVFFDENTKITHCMSTYNGGMEAGNDVEAWLDSLDELEYNSPPVTSYSNTIQNSIGKLTVTCLYYYMGESYGYKYYTAEYRIQSITLDGNSKTADHYAECYFSRYNASMELLDARPDNTYTMQSTTVGVSFSVMDAGVNCSWTFTTPICKIHNLTDVSENHFNMWFDIDEDHCYDTEVTRPGCMVKVGIESHYEAEEVFEVQFATPYHGIWPWDPHYSLSSISLTVHSSFN